MTVLNWKYVWVRPRRRGNEQWYSNLNCFWQSQCDNIPHSISQGFVTVTPWDINQYSQRSVSRSYFLVPRWWFVIWLVDDHLWFSAYCIGQRDIFTLWVLWCCILFYFASYHTCIYRSILIIRLLGRTIRIILQILKITDD